jgi:hypothetical protein
MTLKMLIQLSRTFSGRIFGVEKAPVIMSLELTGTSLLPTASIANYGKVGSVDHQDTYACETEGNILSDFSSPY